MPIASHVCPRMASMAGERDSRNFSSSHVEHAPLLPRRIFGQGTESSEDTSDRINSLTDRFQQPWTGFASFDDASRVDSGFCGSSDTYDSSGASQTRSNRGRHRLPEGFVQDDDGDNSLMLSIVKYEPSVTGEILKTAMHSSQINLRNQLYQTALHLAARTAQPSLVRLLLTFGASPLMQDSAGSTPLHIAAELGDVKSMKALTTPIEYEEVKEREYIVPHFDLLQNGNALDYEGRTPLHIACHNGHLDSVNFLLSLPTVDVNVQEGKAGFTPLHVAVERENPALVELLLGHGAEPNLVSFAGYTPYDRALGHQPGQQQGRVVALLEKSKEYWVDDGARESFRQQQLSSGSEEFLSDEEMSC